MALLIHILISNGIKVNWKLLGCQIFFAFQVQCYQEENTGQTKKKKNDTPILLSYFSKALRGKIYQALFKLISKIT